ncbi:MAG: hypothetical protein JNJ98_20760, partial [Gemmatimonadetes bacterium]|nr:hypothetical protein [Gemmatimonadota bacterium]
MWLLLLGAWLHAPLVPDRPIAPPQRAPDSLRVPILVYHNIQPASEARGIRA